MTLTQPAQLAELAAHSVVVIGANQASSGAYLASPTFPVYRYSWLRDGAFIADAMSRAGDVASAEAFFAWCAEVLVARRDRVDSLIARRSAGAAIDASEHLPTRYTLDGLESDDDWTDFQLDGYGAWLWALDAHARRHSRAVTPFVAGAEISARYIATFWDVPSYDWWEEHPTQRHISTLGAIGAGLRAVSRWGAVQPAVRGQAADCAAAVKAAITDDATRLGRLGKWLGGDDIDASLLAVAHPFGVLPAADRVMSATLLAVEATLVHAGGVHRYPGDTYYGGGEWLLLAGLLGSYHHAVGRDGDAAAQLTWMAEHADADGHLPEQVPDHLLAPAERQGWIDRWGPVASPLLWSHAMYLTLAVELGVVRTPVSAIR